MTSLSHTVTQLTLVWKCTNKTIVTELKDTEKAFNESGGQAWKVVLGKERNVLCGGPRAGERPGKVGQRCRQSQQQVLATAELVRYKGEESHRAENKQERRHQLCLQDLVPGKQMATVQPFTREQDTSG